MKKIVEQKLMQDLDKGIEEKIKVKPKQKIKIIENVPMGVESEWGRLIRRGKIKKSHWQM